MKFFGSPALLAPLALALAGCAASPHTVQVRITPGTYQVDRVQSALATPAVDEVVRIGPERVLMLTCRSTPPAKIIQFEVELRARHQAQLQSVLTDEGCPA
jgi:starvation-inducible outer membrane lipoprotein